MVIIKMNFLSCFRKITKKKYWFADNILFPLCFLYSVDDLISFIVLALDELRRSSAEGTGVEFLAVIQIAGCTDFMFIMCKYFTE